MDHRLRVETGARGRRADDLAEGSERGFVFPDVDDGEAALGAVADVAQAGGLLKNRRSADLEDLVVLGDILAREFEHGNDGHGIPSWVWPLTRSATFPGCGWESPVTWVERPHPGSAPSCDLDQRRSVLSRQLGEQAGDVLLDGAGGQKQPGRDLLVPEP